MFESWIMDSRYAVRRLLRRPTYALLTILTLALGAGGTAAVFSVVRTILLNPLPFAQEERVGVLWFPYSWSEAEFLHLRPNFPGFERMAAYRPDSGTLETAGGPLRLVEGMAASAELFDVLGAGPMLGRTFRAGDDAAGAEPVTVLSHALWEELGSDPSIVGKPLRLGGATRMVVGVMPRGFWFPSPETRLWNARPLDPENRSGNYALVGRISDGAAMEHMEGPLGAIASALGARFTYPAQWDLTKNPSITPVREYLVGRCAPEPGRDLCRDGRHPADRLRERRGAHARAGRRAFDRDGGALGARREPAAPDSATGPRVDRHRHPRRAAGCGAGIRRLRGARAVAVARSLSPRAHISTGRCSGAQCSRP